MSGSQAPAAAPEQIELLRRRLAKLETQLEQREDELQRAGATLRVDASRGSQEQVAPRAPMGSARREMRRHLMRQILDANLELRRGLQARR